MVHVGEIGKKIFLSLSGASQVRRFISLSTYYSLLLSPICGGLG